MWRRVRPIPGCFFLPGAESFQEVGWRPAADVYRHPNGWLAKFDLAGVRPEEIQVRVQGRRLSVRGVRRDCFLEEGCCYESMEISYSSFERQLEFPVDLDNARISTEYQLGMLLVRIQTEDVKGA
jgi:HSP20 family protein